MEAGEYLVRVTLTSNGKTLSQNIRVKLPLGNATPEIKFDAKDIKEHLKVNGPYRVSEVFLSGDTSALTDQIFNLGNTKLYTIEQLQRKDIVLSGLRGRQAPQKIYGIRI